MATTVMNSIAYTYEEEDKIDVELICVICQSPFQNPVNCIKCGQTYCQTCVQRWSTEQKSCPSCQSKGVTFPPVITRALQNQLDRLCVQCSTCGKRSIQRWTFNEHLSVRCPKQDVVCPQMCGWTGYRENLNEHLAACGKKASEKSRWWKLFSW